MKIIALLLCIVDVVMIAISGIMAMISPMAMDSPGSEKSTAMWVFVYFVLASPVAFIVADIMAWIKFAKGNYKASIYWALAGFIPLVSAFIALLFGGK